MKRCASKMPGTPNYGQHFLAASSGASAPAKGAFVCGATARSVSSARKKGASALPTKVHKSVASSGSRDVFAHKSGASAPSSRAHKSGASAPSSGLISSPSLVPSLVEHVDQHSYLPVGDPGKMRAFGPYEGEITPFVVQTGRLPDGVLDWLREDDVFAKKAAKVRASWNPPKTRNLERDCKLEVGILGNKGKNIDVNKIKCNLAFERLKIFLDEFRHLNKEAFACLGDQIADELSVLSAKQRSLNGKQFMLEDPYTWFLRRTPCSS